jgi:anti-anti-sigma regulatory factor
MKKRALEIPKVKKGEPVKATLYVDDELSFINASEIQEDILKHVKDDFDQLNIQASLVHLDLTGIQLLYAIKKTCETFNKEVTFSLKMNEELKTLISRAGFKELL